MSSPERDSVAANVAALTQRNAEYTDRSARRGWAREGIRWGMFGRWPRRGSEHGAATLADSYRWIPEAVRLLCRGGRLVFLHGTSLAYVCFAEGEYAITTALQTSYFELGRSEVGGAGGRGVPARARRLDRRPAQRRARRGAARRAAGPEAAVTHPFYRAIPAEGARRWPAGEIRVARKR